MKILSTGEPSTLGTYKKVANVFGNKAVKFIQKKIDESPNGEKEEVVASERQMMVLFGALVTK